MLAVSLPVALEFLYQYEEDDPGSQWAQRYGGAFADAKSASDWTVPNEPFRSGAEQAIEDVWQTLRANAWGTAPGEPRTEPPDATERDRQGDDEEVDTE